MKLKPETERLVKEEIRSGHFQTVDEMITAGVSARRSQFQAAEEFETHKRLYDLLTQPPFAGSELNLERQKDYPKFLDL